MYDLQIEFPAPPIPRAHVFEIDERTLGEGSCSAIRPTPRSTPGREAGGRRGRGGRGVLPARLRQPANERRVAAPRRAPRRAGVRVERRRAPDPRVPAMVTTACNASTMPVIGPYLDEFQAGCSPRGSAVAPDHVVERRRGLGRRAEAEPDPHGRVGPAAGALAGAWHADRLGESRLLCFDMGGTTAKSCLIEGFEPELTTDFEVARIYRFKKGSGFPVIVPSVDLVEIGAGGGSIARVDDLGLLKVGPDSAGAEPGPACYGRAAPSRPSPMPTSCSATSTPGSSSAATCRSTRRRPTPPWPRSRRASRAPSRHGRRRARAREPEHGRRGTMHAVERGLDLRGTR